MLGIDYETFGELTESKMRELFTIAMGDPHPNISDKYFEAIAQRVGS